MLTPPTPPLPLASQSNHPPPPRECDHSINQTRRRRRRRRSLATTTRAMPTPAARDTPAEGTIDASIVLWGGEGGATGYPGATRSAPAGMAVLPASLKRHHGAENLTGSRGAAQAWRWRPVGISRLDHRRQWRRRRTAVACIIPQHSGLATTRHVCDGRCHDTTPAAPKGGYKRHPWSINEK